MKKPPLQLEGCFFTEVSIKSQPNAEEKSFPTVDVEAKVWATKEGGKRWYGVLTVELKSGENTLPTYAGEVSVFGSFSVDPEWPEEKGEQLVFVNGLGMLYGAARELICSITARGPYKMFMLPSWSFVSMYSEQKARKEETGNTSATEGPASPKPEASAQETT